MSVKNGLEKYRQALEMQEALEGALEEIRKPENMLKYGKQAAGMVKLRTRLGSGVGSEGEEKGALAPLKHSTIKQRQALQSKNRLSNLTTPGKSNLTRTGQLLDSVEAHDPESGSVMVGPRGDRSDSKLSNDEVGAFVTTAGRPFNNLSKTEIKRVNDALKKDIKAIIREQLKKHKKGE